MTSTLFIKPLFILMHGVPAAGKSAFARQFAENYQMAHVNSDRIRYELFDDVQYSPSENRTIFRLASYMTEELLKRRQSIIFDMSLPSQTMRKDLKSVAEKYGYNFLIVWVQTDQEEAMRRANTRDRRRPDDKYSPQLGPQMFERIAQKSGHPSLEREPVVVVSGQQAFSSQKRLVDHKLASLMYLATASGLKPARIDFSRRMPSAQEHGRQD